MMRLEETELVVGNNGLCMFLSPPTALFFPFTHVSQSAIHPDRERMSFSSLCRYPASRAHT